MNQEKHTQTTKSGKRMRRIGMPCKATQTYLLGIDPTRFKGKPTTADMQDIKNHMLKHYAEHTLEDFITAIKQGQSVCPAYLEDTGDGHKARYWKSQQIFMVDIDNALDKDHRIADTEYISVDRAKQMLTENDIHAFFIYKSFSYKERWDDGKPYEKYRICVKLDTLITDTTERLTIIDTLIKLFSAAADSACTNADRVYYGSTPDCELYKDVTAVTNKNTIFQLHEKLCPPAQTVTYEPSVTTVPAQTTTTDTEWYHNFDYDIDKLLFCCNPNCPYDQWIRITAAYKASGGSVETWAQWSAQAPQWEGQTELRHWNTLDKSNRATLIKLAGETTEGSAYMTMMKQAQQEAKQQFKQQQKALNPSSETKHNKNTDKPKRKLPCKFGTEFGEYHPTFLWYPYLPFGEYCVLFGDSDIGKSIFCCGIAAHVTAGIPLPGEIERTTDKVLYINAEDDGDHMKSRVEHCGGDASKLIVCDSDMSADCFLLGRDFDMLENTIAEYQPKLVIIDPWTSYLDSDVDTNRNVSVRQIMTSIRRLAKRHDCCILLVAHVTKHKQTGNVNYAAAGSVDFINVSRSALTIIKDKNPATPNIKDGRILIHTKSNKAVMGNSIYFRTTNDMLNWGDYSEIDVEVLAAVEDKSPNIYTIAAKQHKSKEDFTDLLRTIVQIRKSFDEDTVRVTYKDISVASSYGEDVWKGRVRGQRREAVQSIQSRLFKEYRMVITFPDNDKPFSQLYNKAKTGHGFFISYYFDTE